MPDLIEQDSPSVHRQLKALGFQVAEIRYSYYPGREPGIIINQFPVHGYTIQKRNLITFEVSNDGPDRSRRILSADFTRLGEAVRLAEAGRSRHRSMSTSWTATSSQPDPWAPAVAALKQDSPVCPSTSI